MASAENLVAEVEGDIEVVSGVMRITTIRVRYRFTVPAGLREKADRVLDVYVDGCPAYQSVKDCIRIEWAAEINEAREGE